MAFLDYGYGYQEWEGFPGDHDHQKRELTEYEQYIRRELPPMLRQELESELENELNIFEDNVKTKAIDMIQRLQLRLLESFRKSHSASTPSTNGLPSHLSITGLDQPDDNTGLPTFDILDGVGIEDFDWNLTLDINVSEYGMGDISLNYSEGWETDIASTLAPLDSNLESRLELLPAQDGAEDVVEVENEQAKRV